MNSQPKSVVSDLEQAYSQDIETITRLLAKISNRSPSEIKPHLNTMLLHLVQPSTEPPFYETATASEWVTAFREWAASHRHRRYGSPNFVAQKIQFKSRLTKFY